MIGQEKVLSLIDSFTLETFPRSMLIVGPYGSGKHMLVEYISDKFGLQCEDISKNISIDKIEDICNQVEPHLYIIDMNILTNKNKLDKEQSILLKFIEEPLANSYIIILAENLNKVLPTITNRCIKIELQPYTHEILSKFIDLALDDKLILDIAKTPGELREIKGEKLSELLSFSEKIIDNILSVPFYNALNISKKLAFENEKDKYSLDVFIRVILYSLRIRIQKEDNSLYYFLYSKFNKLAQEVQAPYINKKLLFENCLFSIKAQR